MSQSTIANTADRMPRPLGVVAETGETRPPLTEATLQHIIPDTPEVLARSQENKVLAVDFTVDDPMDLSQTGWCVVFAANADPAIKEALQPLLAHRASQVNNDRLFAVFEGPKGVRPGQGAPNWAANKGVALAASVSPRRGVPFYMLLVGSPTEIPFEFQAKFDLQWAVGRLHFDKIEDYAAYAQHLIDYEKGRGPSQNRHVAVWMPRNHGDVPTALLAGTMGMEFQGQVKPGDLPLGQERHFSMSAFIGDSQATKARLTDILRGQIDGGPPSVLFTGSHGAEWAIENPTIQRERQGALVTQEWVPGHPLQPPHYFAGADLPTDTKIHGLIAFLFACFSGGCPTTDSYFFKDDGARLPLTPEPLVSCLPQKLLSRGALAVIAHVDRAFSYGFEDVIGTPQSHLIRTPLELLMGGKRVGLAADHLNLQWSAYAALLGMARGGTLPNNPSPSASLVTNLSIARDDARNYIVLGDPAVHLCTEKMRN